MKVSLHGGGFACSVKRSNQTSELWAHDPSSVNRMFTDHVTYNSAKSVFKMSLYFILKR